MRTLRALLWCAAALVAQGLAPGLRQQIETDVRLEMDKQQIPGLSIAVADEGKLRWSVGFGLADVENHVPVKPETVFRLGSISKPITAVAVMQLWEAGKIDLDAPVQRYVPSFPAKRWPIQIRQLLAHLGGIRHYQSREEVDSTRHYTDMLEPLRIFQDDPLVAEPGTRYSYTTFGYVLLGAVVEAASQTRFVDYLKANVFEPAGMLTARDDHVYDIIPNRARGYALTPERKLRNAHLADTSNKIPGGGMASTATDLVRFALALRDRKLLKPATVEAMFTAQKRRDGQAIRYGLGWFIDRIDDRKAVLHTGGQQGVHTILILLPREGVSVAMMCNLEASNLRPLGFRLARLLVEGQ